jgi:N-acetylmuramoyl-L-alanine amidase
MRTTILTLLCTFFVFLSSNAQALSVDDVRFGAYPDKTRLVFDMSESSDFRVFTLDSPYRLVVDLPSFDWRAGTVPHNAKAGVSAIRHGNLRAGISRIVFDMNNPVRVESAFVLPRQGNKPDRLVVDITNVSAAAFQLTNGKSYGTLDPGDVSVSNEPVARTASLGTIPQPKTKPPLTPSKKPLIIIDPGHGGVDPGAIGSNGLHEKNVVLALAKELRSQLEASGRYNVKLTRESDVFIKLYDRVKFARQNSGDLFVSIHADSIPRPNVRGASIYTLSDKASDAQTAKLAARENKADLIAGIDLNTEDEEVANILVNLAMRDTMNQSKYFANTLVDEFNRGGVKLLTKPHRYAGFAVLKAPDIPSILVEAGFMSNNSEANMLNTQKYRSQVARAIKQGIDAYFRTVAENERS